MGLLKLTQADAVDSPFGITDRNIEIATAYGLRSARCWFNRRGAAWMDREAFDEAVILAVLRARKNYRPDNPTRATWFTYAGAMVAGAIFEEEAKQRRRPPPFSLYDANYSNSTDRDYRSKGAWGEDVPVKVIDQLRDTGDGPEEVAETRDLLYYLIEVKARECLEVREREMIVLHYLKYMKLKQIGVLYGITEPRVCMILGRAFEKLHAHLGKSDV